jgi:hypothetical protein
MKLRLSKAESIDGSISVDESGESSGHTQVYGMMLIHRAIKVPVSNAGTILIDQIRNLPQGPLWEGSILSVDDTDITAPEAPKKIRVTGRVTLTDMSVENSPEVILDFIGTMHTTSYLQRAWTSILDPDWDGNWSF